MTKKSLCQINHRDLLGLFRSSHQRCSVKESGPKKFANFAGKPLCLNLFLIKLQAQVCNFVIKRQPQLCFQIFKNIYFGKHLRKTASICFISKYYSKLQWGVWARPDLDRVPSEYFLSIAILFH